jgi:hypothetical protein
MLAMILSVDTARKVHACCEKNITGGENHEAANCIFSNFDFKSL